MVRGLACLRKMDLYSPFLSAVFGVVRGDLLFWILTHVIFHAYNLELMRLGILGMESTHSIHPADIHWRTVWAIPCQLLGMEW